MKKFFVLTMAATLMLASCMQVGGSFDTQDRAEIQFQPMTETMTKAPLTAFPNGRTMRVAARYFPDGTLNTGSPANYFPATTYTYSTSNGYASSTGDQVRYWPLDNTGYLNFLSYSTALSVTGETWGTNYTTSLTFTTPDNSTTQDDILVGSKFQATRTATNGNQITFKHAQALIAFQAKSNVAYNSTTNAGITVTGITMNAAAHQGTLAVTRDDASASGVFTGITWTTSTSNNKNNITVPGSTTSRNLTASYQDICTNGIMMPQQTDGGQYIVISYVMHNGKNGTANNDIPMTYRYNMDGRTWLPGNKYIIQFFFQENAITVTTTILDWGNGGTVVENLPHDYSQDYFTVEALEAGTVTYKKQADSPLQYSLNGGAWTDYSEAISVVNGDKVRFKGTNSMVPGTFSAGAFTFSNNIDLSGNVMSLLYGDNFVGQTTLGTANTFRYLFNKQTKINSANRLVLPATTLAQSCYNQMFKGCTSLTVAPQLPATTLAVGCYSMMFGNCTSLTIAPELPATTLAGSCYLGMFSYCTSLTTAPELPATTLAETCYRNMFGSCTSLTTAPELPATTLAEDCYDSMFSFCTSLTTAPELPATTLANTCYMAMFYGCTSLTTAPELPATTLAEDCYYSMFEGCTSLTTAPDLPATTLVNHCYMSMFKNCSSLNYIKAAFTTTPSDTYTLNWVSGVAASGTFVKSSAATWNVTGVNGVPSGWTVQTY